MQILTPPFAMSRKLAAEHKALSTSATTLDENRAKLKHEAAILTNAPEAGGVDWDATAADCAAAVANRRLGLMGVEIDVRKRLAALLRGMEEERTAALATAYHAHQAAVERVRKGMEGIGFVIPTEDGQPIGAIKAAIMTHPAVRAASDHHGSILGWTTRDIRTANDAEIRRLQGELLAARQRAVGMLSA